jgi:hypothetical protein
MTSASVDTTYFAWRIEQGEKETLIIPVLDDSNSLFPIPGWTVDAQVKTRAGGDTLYEWPPEYAQVTNGDAFVTLTIPAPVSDAWTFRTGWFRVVVTDPDSDPDNPNSERILQGPFVVDAG